MFHGQFVNVSGAEDQEDEVRDRSTYPISSDWMTLLTRDLTMSGTQIFKTTQRTRGIEPQNLEIQGSRYANLALLYLYYIGKHLVKSENSVSVRHGKDFPLNMRAYYLVRVGY